MNTTELAGTLRREGYNDGWYSFDRGSLPLEGYVLEKIGARWIIFYSERGEIRDIANFENEWDACEFFYRELQKVYGSLLKQSRH